MAVRILVGLQAAALFCAQAFSSGAAAGEAAFPAKPIRVIVASAPGGPNDVLARAIATPWSEVLGRAVVVDNRAGAAGVIGTELGAKAPADGYTLLFGFQGPLVIAPNFNDKSSYQPLKDFAPVSLVAAAPYVLLVHPNVPAKSAKALIALAKARPGVLNYGSGGVGIGSHMSMELLQHLTGTRMVHVPYKGAGPGMAALIAGEIDLMFASVGAALPHMKSGRLRGVAVGGKQRSPALPQLATLHESGYRVDASSWYGVVAPSATPADVLSTLERTLMQVLKDSAISNRLTQLGFDVDGSGPESFRRLIQEELELWKNVIKTAGPKREG